MLKWFTAVTTAPRKNPTLRPCLDSLIKTGFEAVVFAEPNSLSESLPAKVSVVQNAKKLGLWHNWINACRFALSTKAELILTVQDDSVFHWNSKEFVESILWPDPRCGFVSLYTPKHYQWKVKTTNGKETFDKHHWPTGVRRVVTKSLWGACALVWHRDILEQVINHRIAKSWVGVLGKNKTPEQKHMLRMERERNPWMIKNSDTAIGMILNALNRKMYFIDPSPVDHVATHSAVGHGGNKGRRNAIRIADPNQSLFDQVPFSGRLFSIEGDIAPTGYAAFDRGVERWTRLGYQLSMSVPLDLWKAIEANVTSRMHTLEFGCGLSTTAFEKAKSHTAIESDFSQAARFRCAKHIPLVDGWYDWTPDGKYDLVLVDGPFNGDRGKCVETLKKCCHDKTIVYIDDVHRDTERSMLDQLACSLNKSVLVKNRWAVLT